jgi:Zn-dependent protease with chaperone function
MPSYTESLEAGLVALKQGNYQTAIALLQPVALSPSSDDTSLQAKVGLVMAYARSRHIAKAIALCQHLTESKNSQVQEWAIRALEQLMKSKKNRAEAKKLETGVAAVEVRETPPQGEETVLYWRQARRAKVWQPLGKSNLIPTWLLAGFTFMALFWVLRATLNSGIVVINYLLIDQIDLILVRIPHLFPIPFIHNVPRELLLILLLILTGVSPWLVDWLLAKFYGQRGFSKEELQKYSREAVRVVQRVSQQQRIPLPKLRILPLATPMILAYGNLPRTARIAVSQGLLEQLADDEISTSYALALGQVGRWDLPIMSLVLLVTLPIYRSYQQTAIWGDSIKQRIWRWPVTVLTSVIYGVWCLLTGTALLNSRLRLLDSDRLAAEITGNPNGLIRSLLKMSLGVAKDIQNQASTSGHLESLNILAPISYQQSISLGSIAGTLSFESFLMWENHHPYRQWFTINSSHPLMGDRIERLCQIARHWHLETELHLKTLESPKPQHHSFLLHLAPWLGIPLGWVFAGLIRLIWYLLYTTGLINLKWIYDNWSFVIGCMLIGFSIGIVVRINSFFPDILPATTQTDDHLPNILANLSVSPIDSVSVRLVGKLLGRCGTSNCLAQDLILQSSQGLFSLHHIPWIGQSISPQDWIGRQITVTGWFRRGATPWIDIQTLQNQNGKTIYSYHPMWSIILAVLAQAWGAYIFLMG